MIKIGAKVVSQKGRGLMDPELLRLKGGFHHATVHPAPSTAPTRRGTAKPFSRQESMSAVCMRKLP